MLHISLFITIYILVIAFILGCACGSFIDCMVWRMQHGESVLRGRSHCDSCGHVLGGADLVPLFSYLCLRGRCRYCGAKVPPEDFFAELALGSAFALVVWKYDLSVLTLRYVLLSCILLAISLADLHTFLIPDRFQIAGILLWLATAPLLDLTLTPAGAAALNGGTAAMQAGAAALNGGTAAMQGGAAVLAASGWKAEALWGLVSAVSVSAAMLFLSLLFDRLTGKESLGGGDIKLYFMTGLYMRPGEAAFNLILSCIIGLIFAGLLKKQKIPFGPSISLATFLSILVGRNFVQWYISLI